MYIWFIEGILFYFYHMRGLSYIYFFFISACLTLPLSGWGQSKVIDSLKHVIEQSHLNQGERIEAMVSLSKILATYRKKDEAIEWIEKAGKLSSQEEDGRYGALIQSTKSFLFVQQDSLKRAFQAIDSAEWFASRTKDRIVKGRVRFRRGWLEHMVENTDKAYKDMLEALRLLGDEGTDLYKSNIYHYLSAIHAYWGNSDKQLQYARLCLGSALASGDADAISNAYLSTGSRYLRDFRQDSSRRNLLDSSKYYYKLALNLTDSLQERVTLPSTGGIAALNLANLYFEFYPLSYRDSAEMYLQQSLATGRAVNNSEIIANSYGILSEYASLSGNYERAESLLQMALTEVSSQPGESRSKSRITQALARLAEKKGETDKALAYYKQYMTYDQQLFDEQRLSITQRLETQYESEKKELALAAAQREANYNKKLNQYYLILIVAGFIVLFFLFRSYHFKLKASRDRQLLLAGEKSEAELQANLRAEESARLHVERELQQERVDRLEKELLAGTLQVEEKNDILQNLRNKMELLDREDPLYRQIDRLIHRSDEVDRGYEEIKTEFAEVRPDFTAGLQEKAMNKLTRLDLKYCTYIFMGLTNKEIAMKMNVDPKSIRMARYRIKQKLDLAKEDSLDQFIQEAKQKPDNT